MVSGTVSWTHHGYDGVADWYDGLARQPNNQTVDKDPMDLTANTYLHTSTRSMINLKPASKLPETLTTQYNSSNRKATTNSKSPTVITEAVVSQRRWQVMAKKHNKKLSLSIIHDGHGLRCSTDGWFQDWISIMILAVENSLKRRFVAGKLQDK